MSEETSRQPEKQTHTGPGYLEVIILALILSAATVIGYDRMFAQKIKILDLKGYLRTQKALLAAGELTEQQWTMKLDTVEQILNSEATSHPNHVIVLKDVVLRNGNEIQIK
ncbi:hypothetical protein JWJ90_15630 [Desulfobulbus rhabdoformis]|uniref:hypothetical protein n=1 Tax=Desulfobulbus rhabdoformis TaxID=34032 RepID=UPI001963FC02|nr:hypothetical protein [Desulfobulbus rhabdoformis]MBM9615699.1 hypothetical protein [Desulfobulbus rhabdoformis]